MQKHTEIDWHQRARQLRIDSRAFVGGARIELQGEGKSEGRFDSISPQDGTVVASFVSAGPADVDAAVASARQAFEQGVWSQRSPHERSRTLLRFADLIEHHHEELALLDSLEMGMPISAALPDVGVAADIVRGFAERVGTLSEQVLPSAANTLALNLRVPHGVVAAITPWNFPLYVALAKISPALAMGNSVVLKPSELASLSCLRLGDLALAAGVPAGVFNVLPGLGRDTGRLLALHHGVDCLSFTGSTATGRLLMQYAAQSNLKALMLECGGKSPHLVFDDLGNLDAVAQALVQGFTFNSGQVCVSGTRILVARPLYAPLLSRMTALVETLRSGDPLAFSTQLGPLASMAQLARVEGMVEAARRSGRVVAGGSGDADAGLCHYRSTLIADLPHDDPLMQDEVFGPVAGVMAFDDADHALHLANDTPYGLSATIWTRDFALGNRMARQVHGGPIVVNTVATSSGPSFVKGASVEPTGASGFGVEGGAAGLLAYTRAKSVLFRLA